MREREKEILRLKVTGGLFEGMILRRERVLYEREELSQNLTFFRL